MLSFFLVLIKYNNVQLEPKGWKDLISVHH